MPARDRVTVFANKLVARFGGKQTDHCHVCDSASTNLAKVKPPGLEQLPRAAKAGCTRCAIISEGLSNFKTLYQARAEHEPDQHVMTFAIQEPAVVVYTSGQRRDVGRRYYEKFEFLFYIKEGAPDLLPAFFLRKPVPLESKSDACFDTIKGWLDSCDFEHEYCKSDLAMGTRDFLPTRLIHVHEVRVVESKHISGNAPRYAAVSHTWGKKEERIKPMPILEYANLDDRSRGIGWNELTKTFQDAIMVARHLEIDYIWIDSLCINQDDEDEWVTESSRMAEVYGQAYVVISATRALTGDIGMFHPRPGQHDISIPGIELGTLSVRRRPTHSSFFTSHKPDFSQDPLLERGWCFQERILARRIIHFTEQEIVWECNTALRCECQSIDQEAVYRKEGNFDKEFKLRFNTLLRSKDDIQRKSCWNNILEGYTARKLTVEGDRLPALSGIAQQIATTDRGKYVGGMWEKDLPNALLWTLPFMDPAVRQSIQKLPYIPSWAWASVATAIVPHFENPGTRLTLITVASVLDVQCNTTTADTFGEIDGGYIVLDAPAVEVKLEANEIVHLKSLVLADDVDDCWRFIPDTFTDLPPHGTTLLCVGIEEDTCSDRTSGFLCLILKLAANLTDYIRVGQANCPTKWSAKSQRRTIRIV